MGPSDAKGFVSEMKGKALEAIVEQVRDGSTIRVCLIPSFHFFQVYVAGVQVTYTPFPLCNFFFVWQNIDSTQIMHRLHPWEDEHLFQAQFLKQK